APPPFLRIAAFSTPTVTDTVDADLAEWQAQSHADNESARIAYVRDAQAYAYTPVARRSEPPVLAQAEASAPNLPYIPPVDLVWLDSDGPRG
ncbi:MAG: hypothetical protein ABIO39_12740, partial [Caulobacteraceae bacterium]